MITIGTRNGRVRRIVVATLLLAAGEAAAQTGGNGDQSEAATTPDTSALQIQQVLAPMLVGAIEYIRDDALARGAQRLPDEVRGLFAGHLPDIVLENTRWLVDAEVLTLQSGVFLFRETRALTADNVIVFASDEAARSPLLWAHELYHVSQYAEWGVRSFADRYVADYEAIEHAANDFAFRWKDTAATTTLE